MISDKPKRSWIASPYMHLFEHAILNPHTGRGMGVDPAPKPFFCAKCSCA